MSTIKADNLLRSLIESGLSLTDFAILATKAMKIQRDFRSANEERRERDRIQKHLKIREKRKFERELKEEEERRIKGLAKLYEFGYVTSDDLLTTIDNNNLRTTRTNKFQIASDGDRTDVENSLIPYLKETNDLKAHQRDCCLIFNINNDLRLNQEKIERACRRAKRNIYQLRADRFNRPEYRTICSVETATLYNKFKEAVKEVNHVISDTSIHPKDKRHLNELLTYINQLEGDVGLLMCNLQYEPKVKETIIFAPVTTDILDRMNLILHYVQTLADNISTNSFMTEEKENDERELDEEGSRILIKDVDTVSGNVDKYFVDFVRTPYRLSKAALNRSTSTFLDPLHGSNHKMQATTNQTLSSSPLLSSSSKIFNSDGVYKVIVKTSNKMFAGTDAYVDVQLTGANGTSSKMPLLQSETNQDPFERDHTDTFTIDVKQDLGKIAKLTLSIVGENKSDKYECEWIEINHRTTNKTYRFNVNETLDGTTKTSITISSPKEISQITSVTLKTTGLSSSITNMGKNVVQNMDEKLQNKTSNNSIVKLQKAGRPLDTSSTVLNTPNHSVIETTIYQVAVKIDDSFLSKTDTKVYIELHGDKGKSKKVSLDKFQTNTNDSFERGRNGVFSVHMPNVGALKKVTLSIDGKLHNQWFVDHIEITHPASDRTYRGNIQQNLGGDSRRTELTVDLEEMPSRIGKQQSTNTISAITTVSSNYTASSQASGLTTKLDRTFDTKLPSSVVRQLSSTSVDDTVKEQVIPQRAARQAFLRTSKYDEKIHYKKFFDSLSASDNENDDFEHRNRFSAVDKRKDKKRLQKDNSEQYSISRDESETINFYETRDKSRQKNNRDIEIKEKLVSKDSPQNLVIRPTQGQSSRKSNQQQIESTNERVLTEMKKQGQSVQKVDRSENLIPTVIETNINQVSFHPLQTSKGLLTDTTNSDAVILERREIAAEAKQRQVAEKSENTSDNKLIMFPHSLLPVHNSDVGQGNKTSRSPSWFPSNTSGQLSYPKEESIIPSNTDKITQQNIARFRVSSSLTRQQKNVVSSKRRSYGSSTVSPQLVDLATQPNTNTSKVSSTSQRQNEKMSVTSTFSTPVLGLLTDEPSTTISNTSSYSSITSKVSNFTTPESTITSSKISGDTTTQSSASQANLKLNSTAAHSSKIVTSIEKQMQRPSDYTKTNKTSNQRSNVTDGKSINQKVRSTTSEYSDNDLKFVKQQQTDILTSPIAADTTSQIVTTNHPRNDQEQQSVTIKTSAANSDNDDKSMSSRQTDTSEASGLSGNMLSPDSAKKFRKRKRNRRQQQSKQSSLTEQRDELVKMADDIETFNRDQSTTKSSIISSKTNSHEQLAVHSSRIFSSDNRTKQSIQNTEEQDRRLVASRINTADSDNYMVKEQSRPQFAARSHTKDTIDRLRERESFSFSKSEKSNINDTVERAKRLAITTTNNKRPNYIIEVKTGTNGLKDKDKKHVYLQLLDNKNRTTDEIKIIPLNGDAFGKRKVNYFNVRVQPYLDQVDNIRLWYTGGNKKDIWSIDYVNVSNILTGVKKRFTTKYSLKSDSKVEFINESDYHDDDFYYLIHLASKDTDFNGKPVDAYIQLIGNKSTTDVIKIQIAPRKKKNVQFVDQIKSLQRKDIGSINSVKIWHNDKKNVKQWNLDKIDIYDNRQHEFISFNIKRHLDTKHDDKKTDITLQVSSRENLPKQNSSISISNILTTTLSEDERNDINEVLPISNWLELRDRSPSNNSATRPQSATNRSHSEKTTMIQFENQKQQLISRTQRNDDEN